MRRAIFLAALLLPTQGTAQIQPGDLLVPEVVAGSVVNIRGGGDVSATPRFATGLGLPTSICFGPGDSVYVTAGSEVIVVDAGGDLSGAAAFATGLGGDGRLGCTDSAIFQGSGATGIVFDVTGGGDFSAAAPHATGLAPLTGLLLDSGGRLWAGKSAVGIFDITAGGDFSMEVPFATGSPSGEMAEFSGQLLVAVAVNQVVDFAAGGDLSLAPVFAGVLDPRGLLGVPGLGLFSATGSGSGVWEISAGGDFVGTPAFATGVQTTFGLASLAFVHGCGDAILDKGEECDDGNTLNGDTCDATCAIGVAEPRQLSLLAVGAAVLLLFRRLRPA